MSSEQKEEGTSHYRSGIFVTNAKKDDSRPAVIREEYRDLHDILWRLSLNVEENTKAVKMLLASFDCEEVKKTLPKTQPALVKIRVEFLRIIDIDTKNQNFSADVLIHATWIEPESRQRSGKPSWEPCLTILNIDGKPCEKKRWSGVKELPNCKYPINFSCLRLRAKFREDLELKHFPVDTQGLSIVVSCELPKSIVMLEEDRNHPSTVALDTFEDAAEFHLHQHVIVRSVENNKWDLDHSHGGHAMLRFQCHVSRKPGYHALNIMFLLFLLVGLVFTCYVLPADITKDRLMVALTIVLTTVAFQFKVNSDLPTLSYITYLGGFILMNMFLLIIQVIEIASIAITASAYGIAYAQEVDKFLAVVFILIYLCSNAIYVAVIIVKYIQNRNAMNAADNDYMRRRREAKGADRIIYDEQVDNYLDSNSRTNILDSKYNTRVHPESGYVEHEHRSNKSESKYRNEHVESGTRSHKKKHRKRQVDQEMGVSDEGRIEIR